MPRLRALAACLAAAFAFDAQASCGAAFCLVNTDWSAQGAWTERGVRLDLRFESVDLDQPRHGRDRIPFGSMPRHHDEIVTENRNWIATLDWSFAPRWGLSVSVPLVDREHAHIHNHHGEQIFDRWHFRELGDARVVVRREMAASRETPERQSSWGLLFGAKLPTGERDAANAEGALAERSLQPGSGTTDAIVGAYWHGAAPLSGWSWFARAQAVLPVAERDGFRPGRQLQLDGGLRYAVSGSWALMLQANYLARGRDAGEQAEPDDSGQRSLWFSPGIAWTLSPHAQLYAFVQLPAYQSVNGVQLTAERAIAAGATWKF